MQSSEFAIIVENFNKINAQLEELKKNRATENDKYGSADLKELFTALSKAQGEYKAMTYNRENPYFKAAYADLDAIMKSVRPSLTKYGLAFIQQIRITDEGQTILHSILTHSSGQWMESRMRIVPPKNDAQTFGSTLTYHKRYAAISILGVTVSHDLTDDDAEVAMVDARQVIAKGTALNTKYDPREQSSDTITKEQLEDAEYELAEFPDIAEQVLEGLKIQSLADMPKSKYLVSMKRIREIKAARNSSR